MLWQALQASLNDKQAGQTIVSKPSGRNVCGVHAPLIFQLQRSEADPRRSNELTEEYLMSSL
ncbi:hypothetical protein B0E45_32360 [Sinorhizobium sp. A49]|nr:hypothetical protein B0E45_32360 [Sinorhizobium sp. A49]